MPATGDKAICSMCDKPIVYVGPYWDHEGEMKPRHPAVPRAEASIQTDLDTILDAAQTLRVQQVQATSKWKREYKDKADDAWKRLNEAHKRLTERIGER